MPNNLAIRYHQQDTDTYCGPAVAMMILDAIGSGGLQQADLNDRLNNLNDTDAASPESLLNELNTTANGAYANSFRLVPGSGFEDVTLAMAVQVAAGVPTAALVWGKGHWVVITDVNLGPAQVNNTGGELQGFFIHSPSITPLVPPCQHTSQDACGTDRSFGSLEANQYVSYECWQREFFNGYGDGYTRRFVALSGAAAGSKPMHAPVPVAASAPPPKQANGQIVATYAATKAVAAVLQHRLGTSGPLTVAFSNVIPGEPEYVDEVYAKISHYYLVPMLRDGKRVGVVRIDAVFGTFLGAAAVLDNKISETEFRAPFFGLETGATILPHRLWFPSLESRSPFDPFYQIAGSDGAPSFSTFSGHRIDRPRVLPGSRPSPKGKR